MTLTVARPAQPDLPETLFSVPGMHCAGCISKIERGLAETPGIQRARVNFTAKRVTISHENRLTVPDLVEAIGKLGFEAQPVALPVAPPAGAVETTAKVWAALPLELLCEAGISSGQRNCRHCIETKASNNTRIRLWLQIPAIVCCLSGIYILQFWRTMATPI